MSSKLSTVKAGQNSFSLADIIQIYLLCSENSFYKFCFSICKYVNISSQSMDMSTSHRSCSNWTTLEIITDFCIYCMRIIHNLHVSDCVPADLRSHAEPHHHHHPPPPTVVYGPCDFTFECARDSLNHLSLKRYEKGHRDPDKMIRHSR